MSWLLKFLKRFLSFWKEPGVPWKVYESLECPVLLKKFLNSRKSFWDPTKCSWVLVKKKVQSHWKVSGKIVIKSLNNFLSPVKKNVWIPEKLLGFLKRFLQLFSSSRRDVWHVRQVDSEIRWTSMWRNAHWVRTAGVRFRISTKARLYSENLRIVLNKVRRGTSLCLYLMFILFYHHVTDVMFERCGCLTESRHVHTEDNYGLL